METPTANAHDVSTTVAVQMSRTVFDDLLRSHFTEGLRTRSIMINDAEVFDAAVRLRDLLDAANVALLDV